MDSVILFLLTNIYPGSATCRWRFNRPVRMLKSRREYLTYEKGTKCNARTFDLRMSEDQASR